MDVALPIFKKTCSFRFLEKTVDTLPLIILLKRWSCNLMAGESHRLSGVKRNYSFVFNGQSTVEGVYICVPHDSRSCTAHCIRDQRLEGRLAAIAFLQSFLFFLPP